MQKIILVTFMLIGGLLVFHPKSVFSAAQCPWVCPQGMECRLRGGYANGGEYYCAKAGTAGNASEPQGAIGFLRPPAPVDSSPSAIFNYVPTFLNVSFVAGLIGALIYLIYGGLRWIMNGGDPKGLAAARNTILYAISGVVLLSIAYAITILLNTALLSPKSNSFVATPGSMVTIHTCGSAKGMTDQQLDACSRDLNLGIRNPACPLCGASQDVPAEKFNSNTSVDKSKLCYNTTECDRKCLQNDRLKQYTYCIPFPRN